MIEFPDGTPVKSQIMVLNHHIEKLCHMARNGGLSPQKAKRLDDLKAQKHQVQGPYAEVHSQYVCREN